jgi:glycosyltransferase involved in cell wall biosynthesis
MVHRRAHRVEDGGKCSGFVGVGMRIGLIAPPWITVPPPRYGGTERVVDELARGFAALGHDVLLATTGDSTCPVQTISVYDAALGFMTGAVPFELRHVLEAYDGLASCDVVHDHTILGPLLDRPAGYPPVVWTNHGPFDEEVGAIFGAGCRKATVVAISHSQASKAGRVRVDRVIHHGVDTDEFSVGEGDGGYLLSLGRMTPAKGIATAIDIASAAGVPLLIGAKMNEPAEFEYFEREIRPRLTPDIHYLGEVGHAAKRELLRDALALLNPIAWDEPFGLVMIEALASGTPVVGTPHGAAREIIDDGVTGFLRSSVADLVRCVSRVHELSRSACRRSAETRFSAIAMVDDHLDLYRQLIGGRAQLQLVPPAGG